MLYRLGGADNQKVYKQNGDLTLQRVSFSARLETLNSYLKESRKEARNAVKRTHLKEVFESNKK